MKTTFNFFKYQNDSKATKDLAFLLIRLIIAYGFWSPAIMKLQSLSGTADWFASMGYPAPMLSTILAAVTEISGVFLLITGLATRFIAVPYMLMLFTLLAYGPGRISLDYMFFFRKK